ncbi:hypothetical protein GXB85_00435 [Cellulomonas sp. APG4]|uniref:hypothetical protein n=1 Tax=Cellulomonas sp. APG4 TaxID=1538656 RepID=UPI00137A7F1B|nr:hypothetical protein [Cellulomonas sp. APG4]NCT89424.1 hypothetical protein [Cellulomonas sp. APG4]
MEGPGCEAVGEGWLAEPVAAVTSLAFVVAAVAVLVGAPRPWGRRTLVYAALVAGIGVGSFVQHGPGGRSPASTWVDVAHDLPLLAALALLGADALASLRGASLRDRTWVLPSLVVLVVVVVAPRAGDLVQVALAVVAVVLVLLRARAVPTTRARTLVALGLLAVGGTLGTLSRAGWPLCDPSSPWQGHAAWHVLAAAALVALEPTLGARPPDVRS